jgi:2-succinyl-5-enolpyruvyl-6-hydroxy-3-cyclohexene-1-carboxylate synthase
MSNVAWSRALLERLAAAGVRELVLCAGARNAPLVSVLSQAEGLTIHSFFEERSAGFFAIGRMQSAGKPVAVCTTSGTAVAELLPAVVEAHYQSLPLIVISADRPKAYRGSGAPQTIVQPGIFSHYVVQEWDLDVSCLIPEFAIGRGPLHVNVCFEEPLLDAQVTKWTAPAEKVASPTRASVAPTSIASQRPMVIVGRLTPAQARDIAPTLRRWGRPVYAEGLSHLRGSAELADLEIQGGEESIASLKIDGVIRVGDVPTLRFWRDLEKNQLPVFHFSSAPFSGLPRCKEVWPLEALSSARVGFQAWDSQERDADQLRARKLTEWLGEFPLSEAAWVRRMSEWAPAGSNVLLGNSLPIREWDLAATRGREFSLFGNRGTNGIDGLISTFIGIAEPEKSNWALIGDLSALYDLTGPWALRGRSIEDLNLVIINNGGGKIFERIFKNSMFENSHQLNFENWAKMWGWNYQRVEKAGDKPSGWCPRVIEIVPDPTHTKAFCETWENLKC